jgi:tRNA-dihydrouridine synthase
MGNPWIFTASPAIRAAVREGLAPPADPSVTVAEKMAAALSHAGYFDRNRDNRRFHIVRKHLASYCRGFPNASELSRRLVRVESLSELESVLQPVVCA